MAVLEPKMGGKPKLRVVLQDSPDIQASLLTQAAGGSGAGLQDLVADKYQQSFQVELIRYPAARAELFLPLFEQAEGCRGGDGQPDVVLLSVLAEAASTTDAETFREALRQLIHTTKQRHGPHIIVYNASPLDPDDHTHNYYGLEDTLALRIHKLNFVLMQLSITEGISIINVERLVAELGGQHVPRALVYSPEAYQAICQELLRVLEDIGFFEARPLMVQLGRRGT